MPEYYPGTRVLVFDPQLFKNDRTTPLSYTMRPATVVRWYGYRDERLGNYESCVDVRFDHRPDDISRGHFTQRMEILDA